MHMHHLQRMHVAVFNFMDFKLFQSSKGIYGHCNAKKEKTKILIGSGVRHLMRAVYEVEEHAQRGGHRKLVMRTATAAHAHNLFRRTTHVLVAILVATTTGR